MKEARIARFQELQLPHRHICDMISMYLNTDPNEMMEGVVDDQRHLDLLQDLLVKNGRKCIFFFYQDGPPYPLGMIFLFEIKRFSLS